MTDLAARLREVIEERLRVAREATPGPWLQGGRSSDVASPNYVGNPPHLPQNLSIEVYSMDAVDLPRQLADATFIALNDPSDTILAGERDLGVIERHRPDSDGGCIGCGVDRNEERRPWPCIETRSLAKRYGIEVE